MTGNDIDDREQWSVRGSFRWEIGERTVLDVIGHRFEEDSSRSRSQKQLCIQDPSPILGCIPDGTAFQPVQPFATAGTLLSSDLILGPLGLFQFADSIDLDPNDGTNPADLRKVRLQLEPEYESYETFAMFELQHELTDTLDLNFIGAYQETKVLSRQDYNGTAPDLGTVVLPTGFCAFSPAACQYYGTQDGGPVWTSTVPNVGDSLGAIGGGNEFELTSQGGANDISRNKAEQFSFEARITSAFDGPINFMAAAYYLEFENETNYNVKGPVLDYPAQVLLGGALDSPTTFGTLAPGFFDSVGDRPSYELESTGIFGELYWEATDTVKFTFGLRWTEDKKTIRDRQVFLNVPVLTDITTGTNSLAGEEVNTIHDVIRVAAANGLYDADPNEPGNQEWRESSETFDEITGRFVVDWTPDVNFTDESLFYFSFSRGYKGGGINPPIDTTLFPNTPTGFEPEDIDAYEIGTKNSLWDNRMQINMALFYYDYGGLQIGKIVNRTSLNENTDAEVFGFEGEFILAPTENWLFNAQVSYLDTELKDTDTIDPRDPTQGRQDVSLFKDFSTAANCVLEWNGNAPANQNAAFRAAVQGAGAPYIATGENGVPTTPGEADTAVSACAAIEAIGPAFGYGYLDSVPLNLEGNEISGAPAWTFTFGAQYTWFMDNGWSLQMRGDYYWQDGFFSTTFNRPQDKQSSYDLINLQATLYGRDNGWYVRAFAQNIEDDDEITGTYETDPSSGLFTNVFLVEPRIYGLTLGVSL